MENNNNNIDLIVKYLSGDITHDEIIRLESWMEEKSANRNLFDEYKSVWDNFGKVADTAEINVGEEWNKMQRRMDTGSSRRRISGEMISSHKTTWWITRIAAVLMIGIFLGITVIILTRNTGHVNFTATATSLAASLPDGSQVILNSGSFLKSQKKFGPDRRVVELDGEAYFEIVPDADRPFIIRTDKIEIMVLGTSFNVNAYSYHQQIEVVVNSGQVALTKDGDIAERIILKPGNKGTYNKADQSLQLSVNEDPNWLSWKTRQFVFENRSLEEIVTCINNVYHSGIVIRDDSLKGARITTSFNNQSPEAILNVLAATLDLEVTENNGNIVLSGKD